MIAKCSCQKSMKLIALVFFIAATVSAQNSSGLWQYGNKFYDAANVKAIPTVRGKVQWVQDGVVGFETEKATSEIAVGSSVVPTDWEPDSLIAVTNFPDMANATVNKWAMYKMVKIGIYNGYESQPIELYDCGKPYVPPPPKPLTPEQIAAAKAKAEASKKSGAAAALKSNQDAAAKGDSYGLMRMGERYRDGDGVDKDLAKAKDYLQKAADAGSPTAADELSKLKQ